MMKKNKENSKQKNPEDRTSLALTKQLIQNLKQFMSTNDLAF